MRLFFWISCVVLFVLSFVFIFPPDRGSVDEPKEDVVFREDVSLVFVGDIMLSRSVGKIIQEENDFSYPFGVSRDFFSSYDIIFGNLENPISERGRDMGSVYSFRADLEGEKRTIEAPLWSDMNELVSL